MLLAFVVHFQYITESVVSIETSNGTREAPQEEYSRAGGAELPGKALLNECYTGNCDHIKNFIETQSTTAIIGDFQFAFDRLRLVIK